MTDFSVQSKTFLDNNIIQWDEKKDSPFPYMDKNGNELKTSNGIPIKSIYDIFFVDNDLNIYFLATNMDLSIMDVIFSDKKEYYMWIKIGDKTFEEHQFYTKEWYKIEWTNLNNMDDYYNTTFFNVKVRNQDWKRIERMIKLRDPEWKLIKTNKWRDIIKLWKVIKYQDINIYSTKTEEDGEYIALWKYDWSDELIEIELYYKKTFWLSHQLFVDMDYLQIYINNKVELCRVDDEGNVYTKYVNDGEYLWKLIIKKK